MVPIDNLMADELARRDHPLANFRSGSDSLMKLILLRCPTCGEGLKPEQDDIVVACNNCHTPVWISQNGATKAKVQFAIPKAKSQRPESQNRWLPFWVFEGQVEIIERVTQGGRSRQKEAEKLWQRTGRFYVPAWDIQPHTAQSVGIRLIQHPPEIELISRPAGAHLEAASVDSNDARKLLEFIVLAIEARRKDWLKDLNFRLKVDEAKLWALPAKSITL
jgi:hypothetical protein